MNGENNLFIKVSNSGIGQCCRIADDTHSDSQKTD